MLELLRGHPVKMSTDQRKTIFTQHRRHLWNSLSQEEVVAMATDVD